MKNVIIFLAGTFLAALLLSPHIEAQNAVVAYGVAAGVPIPISVTAAGVINAIAP